MLDFLRDKNFFKSNRILGVHYYLHSDGALKITYVLLFRNKGKIVTEKKASVKSIEELKNDTPSGIPVYLSLDGKGILTKKVVPDPTKSLIHQAIPNASEEEFLVQQFEGTDNHTFISLLRKNSLEEILTLFTLQKLQVIGLTIGPLILTKARKLFDSLPTELSVGPYRIFCSDQNQIIELTKEGETNAGKSYRIGNEEIPSSYLLPYYHALTYYVPEDEQLQYPMIAEQFDEYTSKRIFVIAGWAALSIIFLILLINIMVFTSYSEKQKKLETRVSGNKEMLVRLKQLKDELTWKEKVLGQAGILGVNRMSYYTDRIALTIPEDINLGKFEINPVVDKIRKQKEIEIEPDKMVIDGVARNNDILNNWVHTLKQQLWVGDVSVINYSKDDKSAPGTFSIEIKISGNK
jgi:Tfp pilus assembly protein PilN